MNLKTSDPIYCTARSFYNNRLYYHNFHHVIDILDNAKKILKQCDYKSLKKWL